MDISSTCIQCKQPLIDDNKLTNTGLTRAAKAFMIITSVMHAVALLVIFVLWLIVLIAAKKTLEFEVELSSVFLYIMLAIEIFSFSISLWLTVSYSNKVYFGERVGVGFKICTLLFVSLIAGFLMLLDRRDDELI